MHIRTFAAVTLATSTLVAAVSTASPAEARIVCRDGFQVVRGREISTPYCEHNYLAQVARKYGVRVSDAEVRNNPARKNELCRMIGHDIRVSGTCAGEEGSRSRGN